MIAAPRPLGPDADRLRTHHVVGAPPHGMPRRLRIWLPAAGAGERHPVLYVLDGQNAFDDASAATGRGWRLHTTADRLTRRGRLRPVILVAIDNAGAARTDEYTPVPMSGRGGHLAAFAQLLVATVKPFVDANYPTLPEAAHTAVCGASLGGLGALALGLQHSGVFGAVGALSPSLWWARGWLPRAFAAAAPRPPLRMWLDTGRAEAPAARAALTALGAELQARGWTTHRQARRADLRAALAAGSHDERSWGRRAAAMLSFLFPPPPRRRRR